MRAVSFGPSESFHGAFFDDLPEVRSQGERAGGPVFRVPQYDKLERHRRRWILQTSLSKCNGSLLRVIGKRPTNPGGSTSGSGPACWGELRNLAERPSVKPSPDSQEILFVLYPDRHRFAVPETHQRPWNRAIDGRGDCLTPPSLNS